ncbi:MAG: hypothetical protein LC808_03095 [Actinobacteria bacterium]|nr:hypothetical protein [Actinomycetota bacterium]
MVEPDPAARGQFPFGRNNTTRPLRPAAPGRARILVVGVYPSAFHVSWSPPADYDRRPPQARTRPFIASLAVDVEPVVFWDGVAPTPAEELARWKLAISFDDARHGAASVGRNGPTGAGVLKDVLGPLGVDAADVAFTDVVPWFFVKHGKGSQGEAINERFNPLAGKLQCTPATLPPRPSASALVRLATAEPRRASLRAEVLEAEAPLVITVGQEALAALGEIADAVSGVQTRLAPEGYGAVGTLSVAGRRFDLLPLVHPGFQRQTTNEQWRAVLAAWKDNAGKLRP